MNRGIFIRTIEQLHNDCFHISSKKGIHSCLTDIYKDELKNSEYSTMREYFKAEKNTLKYELDIKLIKQITNNNITNPFNKLYELNQETIEDFYIVLANTHQAIFYYERYSIPNRDMKEQDKLNKGTHHKSKKIQEVIDIIYDMNVDVREYIISNKKQGQEPASYRTILYLAGLLKTLNNNHYTELQLYQNLLYEMYHLLKDKFYKENNKDKKFSKSLIFDIVNRLVKYYFRYTDEDLFSTRVDFNKYIEINYIYETMAGITLTHSTKGM